MKGIRKSVLVATAAALLLSLTAAAEPRAARGRAGDHAPRVKSGRDVSAPRAAPATRGTTRVRAGGTATYAYGGGRHLHHPHHGSYGYYGWGPGWGWYGGWGWPYYGYGYYAYAGYPTVQRVSVDRDELPAVIETDVRPKRAEVWLDGELIGQARDYNGRWDLLYVEPGEHDLEFRREDRVTLALTMNLRPGYRYVIDEELAEGEGRMDRSVGAPPADFGRHVAPAPADGELERGLLRIRARPGDAAVYLDGEFLASAGELERLHGALPVATGTHVVEVARPGYKSRRYPIDVVEGTPAQVEIELERE